MNRYTFAVLSILISWQTVAAGNYYVSNAKPGLVSMHEPEKLGLRGMLRLKESPRRVIPGPDDKRVYILQGGYNSDTKKNEEAKVAIVDPAIKKTIKTIPIGWNAGSIRLTEDLKYLICVSHGVEDEGATITLIGTETDEVARTFKTERPVQRIPSSPDGRIFYAIGVGSLTIYDANAEEPAEMLLDGPVSDLRISVDGKWLYLLERGNMDPDPDKRINGTVYVVDTEARDISAVHEVGLTPRMLAFDAMSNDLLVLAVSPSDSAVGRVYRFAEDALLDVHDVGMNPSHVIRLGDSGQRAVVSYEDIRVLRQDGTFADARVLLNRIDDGVEAEQEKSEEAKNLGYVPGDIRYLPKLNRGLIALKSTDGQDAQRVGIVDFNSGEILDVITTGSARRKVTGGLKTLLAVAAVAAVTKEANSVNSMLKGAMEEYADLPFQGLKAVVDPEEKYAYVYNDLSQDVTIIDLEGSKKLEVMSFGWCKDLFPFSEDRFCAYTDKKVVFVNSSTGEVFSEVELDDKNDELVDVIRDVAGGRVLALTKSSFRAWSEDGEPVTKFSGFSEPVGIAQPVH